MPSTSDPQKLLLGPWPPENWRRDAETEDRFPVMSLRRDLRYILLSRCGHGLPWVVPAMSPIEVLTALNGVGPRLDARALPVIEAVLEGMYADGVIGRVPPAVVGGAASYTPREVAERNLPRGTLVTLLPPRGGGDRGPHPPRPLGPDAPDPHLGTGQSDTA